MHFMLLLGTFMVATTPGNSMLNYIANKQAVQDAAAPAAAPAPPAGECCSSLTSTLQGDCAKSGI